MNKPTLIYDGECEFCRLWVERWRSQTGGAVEYAPYQEAGGRFPGIRTDSFRESACYVAPDGAVTGGAKAVFMALAAVPKKRWLLQAYERAPLFGRLTEAAYRLIRRHRPLALRLTRLFLGTKS